MFWSISPLSWPWRRANTWNVSFETPNSGQFTLSTQLIIPNKQINVSIKIFLSLVGWSYLYLPKFQGNNPLLVMYWKVSSKCEWYPYTLPAYSPSFWPTISQNQNFFSQLKSLLPHSWNLALLCSTKPNFAVLPQMSKPLLLLCEECTKKTKSKPHNKRLVKYSTKYFAHAQNIFTWHCTIHIGVSKEWKTLISIS